MTAVGGGARCARALVLGLCLFGNGCALVPSELNFSPIYRHRLDEQGGLLELDVLWPIVHYERTPTGGDDFRIRPLWRRVTEPVPGGANAAPGVEHQFLWPLGRIRSDAEETSARLFPLFWHRARRDEKGDRETDYYFLFPFVWGGSSEDGTEDYFAVFPLYVDIPEFLVYDRVTMVAWPLYTAVEKGGQTTHLAIWPLIQWDQDHTGRGRDLFKALPFFGYELDPDRYERWWAPWPFVHWGTENLGGDDPVDVLWLWPLLGRMQSETVDSATVFWPFFQKNHKEGVFFEGDAFWPVFHVYRNRLEDDVRQWWIWPVVAHTVSDRQESWNFLWPIVWLRRYEDPDSVQTQQWVVPLFWHVRREYDEGGADDFVKVWPLVHVDEKEDGSGGWSVLSPWPWREGNAYGMEEAYGWLWTLARGRSRSAGDHAFDTFAHLYTRRSRTTEEGTRTQASVPFLFNWEGDEDGGTLRLFQLLPIPFGGGG